VPIPTFLVEDNPLIRNNLIAAMEEEIDIHLIGTASTEAEAIARLDAADPPWELLVVDLFLEEGSGLGIVKRYRERRPGQRVVVLTSYGTDDIAGWARELGADAVFDKSDGLDDFFSFCAGLDSRPQRPAEGASDGPAR